MKIDLLPFKKVRVPRKALYITAGIIVLLAVIVVSMALSERQTRIEAAENASESQRQKDAAAAVEAEIRALRASEADKSTRLSAVCGYVQGLSLNKAARPIVVVPPACK